MLPSIEFTEPERITLQELADHNPYSDFRLRALGNLVFGKRHPISVVVDILSAWRGMYSVINILLTMAFPCKPRQNLPNAEKCHVLLLEFYASRLTRKHPIHLLETLRQVQAPVGTVAGIMGDVVSF
jgi:hypothetical protein